MRKALLCLPLAAVLSGCSTTKVMNGIMSSWEGASVDDVVRQWGYPDEQRDFNGRKLYVWHHNQSAILPSTTNLTGLVSSSGQVNATATTWGGGVFHGYCTRTLEVDGDGKVVNWEWEGNNCPFAEAMEYKTWRRRP